MKTYAYAVLAAIACGQAGAVDLPGMAGGSYALHVTSLKEARFRSTVRQQFDFSCGSAALATLLSYHYDTPVSERQVFDAMYAQGDQQKIQREGFSLLDMKRYLAGLGFIADGYQQPLHKLAEARFPAIVRIRENGYEHFVVIKGVDESRVLLGDPAGGTRAMRRADFEAVWQDQLLFLIHNWRGQPRFNQAADWRVAPRAPLEQGINRGSLTDITLPKNGSGNY
ncbi:peptidase C39 bacteriocin processing [Janthinobacterium sp. HH01]|uniref:C39 family peptidase n=1 Tax=Janthinobacterium sp. HH01 TaxID=1198452 RepID=UPI0002AECE6B|nr:C39 family peptidase [Janthinobacterium sp. HH01]ELX08081.1 peptidase C39 bacteriocin processing [Janthinobacterium sp. HH01]